MDVQNNHIIEKQPVTQLQAQQNGVKMVEEPVKGKNPPQPNISNLLANDTIPVHVYKERRPNAPVLIEGKFKKRTVKNSQNSLWESNLHSHG